MSIYGLILLCMSVVISVLTTPIEKPAPKALTVINCNRPNEHYECGSACQTECATLGASCPIMNVGCNNACYCVEGYARNSSGDCILISKC